MSERYNFCRKVSVFWVPRVGWYPLILVNCIFPSPDHPTNNHTHLNPYPDEMSEIHGGRGEF